MCKLHCMNSRFFKKFKEMDVNSTNIFLIREFYRDTFGYCREKKNQSLMFTIMYLWICDGNVDRKFSTNEKLNFFGYRGITLQLKLCYKINIHVCCCCL